MNRVIRSILPAVFLIVLATPLLAQEIMLDVLERAEGLVMFQSLKDPLIYYYVPNNPRVATREDGRPEFSFLKYVKNVTGQGEGGIGEASGGGVVHFLITYEIDPDVLQKAEQQLKQKTGEDEARIAGPVIFRSGNFTLVSSIANEEGDYARKVIGIGKAPLVEGMKAAVSMDLTPDGASLLWASFQTDTPDISIVFDMEVAGYRSPFEATLEVDWDQVYGEQGFGAEVKLYFIGFEAEATLQKLTQNGGIKLTTKGESASMQPIIERAHSKMIDMMFEKVNPPPEERNDTDVLSALAGVAALSGGGGNNSGSSASAFSIGGHYKFKELKRSGKAQFDFNHIGSDSIDIVMAGNIGDLYKRFGADEGIFATANLDDPVFKQREVFVTVDGRSEQDFSDYVNFVQVQLRKNHESGEQTVDEVVVDRESFKKNNNRFRMVYGWKGDDDREVWLKFDYKTTWNFRSGIQVENDWEETDAFVINVTPPYEYRRISLEADPDIFEEAGVRHAVVKLYYKFFDKVIPLQTTVRVKEGQAITPLEYVCQSGNYDYDYEITWYIRGNKRLSTERLTDSSDILYVDELPQ